MGTLYKGKTAKKVCEMILAANEDWPYTNPIEGYDHKSSGYYKEGKVWIAFDNTTEDCWIEEFESRKDAVDYATT